MYRLAIAGLILVALLLPLATSRAQSPPALDDRVAALETRVAALEARVGPPSQAAPPASDLETPPGPAGHDQPTAGQPCPAAYHNQITTTGPDGNQYPTWHPAVDPATGCTFGHEHGDDPRTSLANSTLPAFGYIGRLAGDEEPHVGFKVFVQNAGATNNDGRTLAHHSRIVFHMGTGGPKRFSTRFHSMEYDFVEVGGSDHEVHLLGMADTGGVDSICANPRQGKTVMVLPDLCATSSNYEIWSAELRVELATAVVAVAVFDPITILDPADPSRQVFLADHYRERNADPHGCVREAYSGPVYFYNRAGPTSFTTDAYGKPDPNGVLIQRVSQHDDLGVPMTTDGTQTQAKLTADYCAAGLTRLN